MKEQAKTAMKMKEEERQWQEQQKERDSWEEYAKYTTIENYEVKLHFETSDTNHDQLKEVIQSFFEKVARKSDMKVLIVYEYYKWISSRRKWEIRLNFIIGIPLREGYDEVFNKYLNIRQEIHDLEYTELKQSLKGFKVTYEYYKLKEL